jgi:hypothetical protein
MILWIVIDKFIPSTGIEPVLIGLQPIALPLDDKGCLWLESNQRLQIFSLVFFR